MELLQAEREMICKTLADGRVVWKHEKEVMRGHISANRNRNRNPNRNPNPNPTPDPNPNLVTPNLITLALTLTR